MNTDNVEGSRNKLFILYVLAWKKSLPSVLCTVGWAAGRASGLWKLSGVVLAWLSAWSEVHPFMSCSSKIQNGLPFWRRLTQIVLEKGH